MKRSILFSVSLVILAMTSCNSAGDQPDVAYYRFIQQITSYHEDGHTSYQDFVALAGVATFSGDKIRFNLMPDSGDGTVEVTVRSEGDTLFFSVGGVETPGGKNRWVRLKKRDSATCGSDAECEVWVGPVVPPTTDTHQGARPDTNDGAD